MEDLLRASLEYIYDTNIENMDNEDKYTINVAYHEAGHTLRRLRSLLSFLLQKIKNT